MNFIIFKSDTIKPYLVVLLILAFIGTFVGIVLWLSLATPDKDNITRQNAAISQYPIDSTNLFYNGQILYPDYVHDDTLVVFNAKELNKDFDRELMHPATDEEIDFVLHMYAMSINLRITEFMKGDTVGVYRLTVEITH